MSNFPSTVTLSSPPHNGTAKPHHRVPHFAAIPNEAISFLTPYSGLLLTLWLIILYAIKRYFLEMFLFPRCYKQLYKSMEDSVRRGFLVHHISAGTKVVLLIVGAKPFSDVVFGKSSLHDRYSKYTARPTMGDMLLVLTQLFVALYLFELMIRKSPSPIAVSHHVGAVVIAQAAVALSLQLDKEANATMEYVLCLVWAAFDVLAELWLNVAFILYRIYPKNYALMAYVFGSTGIISIMGTVAETVMVMTLFGQSWDQWDMSFKVVTPILHVLFTIAQIHAARILFHFWMKYKKLLAEEERDLMDPEGRMPKQKDGTKAGTILTEEPILGESSSTTPREASLDVSQNEKPKKLSVVGHINKFFTGRS
ncbi:hypothetical protein BT63DRAFT_250476 [Microthyrium microscopicum]|uniref:TLC domain-containing protein n=1 Tax=Microthyrium microscopicum TaxID=703497 RepID=A0A6A6UAY0_9PEZI|nr:hypothetical protein BT63DRAFT_250476 [Microthyrium microscopicum]